MERTPKDFEFLFDGKPVGVFLEATMPDAPGRYRYEPYRSFGHYEMHTTLNRGERPICTVGAKSFRVDSSPAYGVIELSEFNDLAT